mmetsp:Transcript_19809/g.47272  ORF Transcript_19809/g.47272 Transcript_19809/m.47272 type:complete len:197 (-) Transcript_19809:166-756(-)
MSKKKQATKLRSVTYKGHTFHCNDCVLINPAGDNKPFIGRIRAMEHLPSGTRVQVAWFYRPEECLGGRKVFHGERELFSSDHLDWCTLSTIDGICYVHSLKAYQALEELTEDDFYSRFTYKPATNEFKPERVPVYCVCEMPYNPDRFMVQCESCEEWYHPECVGVSRKQIDMQSTFCCSSCRSAEPEPSAKARRIG